MTRSYLCVEHELFFVKTSFVTEKVPHSHTSLGPSHSIVEVPHDWLCQLPQPWDQLVPL